MSSKLVKELNKVHKKEIKNRNSDDILNDVKQLLLEAHNDDHKMLIRAGLDHQIKYSKKLQIDEKRSQLAEEKYNETSYSGKEIKELCNEYDLRMLPSKMYNGSIPVDLARKMKEFEEKNDLIIKSNSLYILAPVEQFNTIKHVPIQADPILFYNDNSRKESSYQYDAEIDDNFISIHNWGNDFTFLRKFRWLINPHYQDGDTISNCVKMILLSSIFIITLLINIFCNELLLTYTCNIIFTFIAFCSLCNAKLYKEDFLNKLWNTNET